MKYRHGLALFLCVVAYLSPGCATYFPSHQDTTLYTAIFAAAEGGDLATVISLVKKDPTLVNAKGIAGRTPLHLAVLHDHKDVVTFLLDKSANVNARTDMGVTPLHEAAQAGSIGMLKLLLGWHADMMAKDAKGRTPLDYAEEWDEPEAAEFFRNQGGRSGH
jgi:ankyrin repeat protein